MATIGKKRPIQGMTMTAISITAKSWYKVDRVVPRTYRITVSSKLMSLVNRLIILPIGVVSKYKLIGAFRTRSIIYSCNLLFPCHEKYYSVAILAATHKLVAIVKPK